MFKCAGILGGVSCFSALKMQDAVNSVSASISVVKFIVTEFMALLILILFAVYICNIRLRF